MVLHPFPSMASVATAWVSFLGGRRRSRVRVMALGCAGEAWSRAWQRGTMATLQHFGEPADGIGNPSSF